jgi:hypothetical protein
MADAIPTLSNSTEKICFVVLKAREFDVKDADTSSDEDGSKPADDRMVEVLEDRPDDPVDQELGAFIQAMSEDEQVDLVTLTWLGQGDSYRGGWVRQGVCARRIMSLSNLAERTRANFRVDLTGHPAAHQPLGDYIVYSLA